MYLPQAVSLPPLLRIDRDLFRCRHLVEEVELELAVVGCSVVVPLFCNRGRCAGERSGLSCVGSPPGGYWKGYAEFLFFWLFAITLLTTIFWLNLYILNSSAEVCSPNRTSPAADGLQPSPLRSSSPSLPPRGYWKDYAEFLFCFVICYSFVDNYLLIEFKFSRSLQS